MRENRALRKVSGLGFGRQNWLRRAPLAAKSPGPILDPRGSFIDLDRFRRVHYNPLALATGGKTPAAALQPR